MYVWQHVRLFASLPYVCTESMATRHCGLLVFDSKSFFLSFFLSYDNKSVTTEATSCFLDLVLSLQDSDKYIYFYISV